MQVKAKATEDEGVARNGVDGNVVIGVELVEVVAREVLQLDEKSLRVQWCGGGRFLIGRSEEGALRSVVQGRRFEVQWFKEGVTVSMAPTRTTAGRA